MFSFLALFFYGGLLLTALGPVLFFARRLRRWRRWGWPAFWFGFFLVLSASLLWGLQAYRLTGESRFLFFTLHGGFLFPLLLVGLRCVPSLAPRSLSGGDDPSDAEERIR